MKRKLLNSLMICLAISTWSIATAQDPSEGVTEMGDTLVIQPTFNGNPLNALNEWILWDHDGDLANAPKHSVYKLLQNERYPITTTVNVNGRTHLVAEKPDLDNKPPQVGIADDANGNSPGVMFAGGPYTWKNIWFMHLNYSTMNNNGWGLMAKLEVDSTVNIVDGCYFEHIKAIAMKATTGKENKVYFTNNFYNDCGNGSANMWHGHFFNSENHTQDSIVFRNNTFINTPGILLNVRKNMTRYIEISNNTMINTCAPPFFTTFWIEGVVKNNLLWNVYSRGEDEKERIAQEPDNLAYSMINIDTLANEFTMTDPTWLDRESERTLELKNNYYGSRDDIEAIWASADTIFAPQWMNSRTTDMFADDANYPGLTEENTWTKADLGVPEFETAIKGTDSLVKFVEDVLWGSAPGFRYVWEPEGADVPNADLDWPPLEDLRIKSSGFVGDDGKPLGDLNWYPEYAQRWNMTGWGRETVGIFEKNMNSEIELNAFPNPFTNGTRIAFNLTGSQEVKLSVYDYMGRNVAVLFEGTKSAGQHTIEWNGANGSGQNVPAGVYFIRVDTENGGITHKLLKL